MRVLEARCCSLKRAKAAAEQELQRLQQRRLEEEAEAVAMRAELQAAQTRVQQLDLALAKQVLPATP